MGLSLAPDKLKKYKNIAALLIKYSGDSSLKDPELDHEETSDTDGKAPDQLVKDLEELGPTYIKLGQLLSTRPDFLPTPYIEALSKLQDDVEPFTFEEVEKIIEEELNVRLSKAFSEFNSEPIAAASLGQVHHAVLRNGTEVAVKVQRPGIKKIIIEDLEALADISSTLDKHTEMGRKFAFHDILDEFKKTLLNELDYLKEAQNLIQLKNNLRKYENILIPDPVKDYTTSKVLTMSYIKGTKVTKISPLARLEIDGASLATDLFRAYLDQVLVDGFFHADPHPGNVFITEDHKIALIDLGMVARVDPELREKLLKLLLNVSEGKGNETAKICLELGIPLEHFDKDKFFHDVSDFVTRYQDASLDEIKVGRVVVELARLSSENGIRSSPELTMLGKTLLNLDEIGKTLEPSFNPNQEIKNHAQSIMQKHMLKNLSPGNIFSSVLEANEFIQKLPGRLNAFFDNISENKFIVKVDAFDENNLTENLQKIANRIAMGLILAALIIGAALMMSVQTEFTIFGYPGIAMLLFFIAGAFGFGLVISIMLNDRHFNKNKK
jgi:ubiquinone biosynthesis protein